MTPKPTPKCKKCRDTGLVTEYEVSQPFNPGSPPQKKALIRHFGLKVPKKRGTDDETTEAKYLKRFGKKHPVFNTILECQQRSKLLTTYLWEPRPADGRVSTQFGFNPSTWRKSSRNVNLQNIPKRYELAKLFRKMLIAPEGHLLVEADSSAIEAVLVGYCAGDPDYMRMARLGVHDFVGLCLTGHTPSPSAPDEELRSQFSAFKREHPDIRETAKRGVHASNYLLSPFGLNDEYPEYFPTVKKGKEFQEFYFGLFPKLRGWHTSTLDRAHKETFLDNHFQYRHYFYDIYAWDKRADHWRLGEDAKRAVAFVPQSDASAIQTEYLHVIHSKLTASGLDKCLRLIIHDSFVLEVPEEYVEEVVRVLYEVMTAPIPELGGLAIGAEISVGPNLGEMQPVDMARLLRVA